MIFKQLRTTLAGTRLVVVSSVVMFLLIIAGPSLASAPALEGMQLAVALRNAEDEESAEQALRRIFSSLGVPIVAAGPLPQNSSSFVLHAQEVAMLSKAFKAGVLLPLEDVVASWTEYGVECGAGACTAQQVEAALRQMRFQAEVQPGEWEGLVIHIIDELGQRERSPFRLLGAPDNACMQEVGQFSPLGMMGDTLAGLATEAEEDGDQETAAIAEGLAEEGLPDFLAGMASGNMRGFLGPIMEQVAEEEGVSADELWGDWAEAEASLDEEEAETPEIAAMMQSAQKMMGLMQGGSLEEALKESEKLMQSQQQALQSLQKQAEEEAAQHSRKARQELVTEDGDAEDAFELGFSEMGDEISLFFSAAGTTEAERLSRLAEEEFANAPSEEEQRFFKQPLSMQFPVPTSCLVLDPVQVVLLELYFFDLVSYEPEGGQ